MSVAEFSESGEAYRNRQESGSIEKDIEAYRQMKEAITTAAYVARENMKLDYPKAFELFEASEEEGGNEDAFDDLIKLKNKDKKLDKLVKTLYLEKSFRDLGEKINSYIGAIHTSDSFRKQRTEVTDDVMSQVSDLDGLRSKAHDALIAHLRSMGRMSEELGIDNTWMSVVGYRMGIEYRKEIQRWAQHISDYFVSISETTV